MQFQFKYCGKEINKEDFNKLQDVFKWVTNSTVNAIDFNSVFDGKYKSMREINDHVKSLGLLPLEPSKSDCDKVEKDTVFSEFIKKSLLTKGFDPSKGCWFYDMPISAEKVKKEEIKTEEKDSVINKEETPIVTAQFIRYISNNPILEVKQFNSLQEAEDWFKQSIFEEVRYIKYGTLHIIKSETKDKIQPIGVKHNKHKLPMSKLFVQFPDALQAIVLASCYGHHCYPTDTDWLNFKRVGGGSENYKDASIRHLLGGEKDKESNLPEIFHQAWNKLAELQLWLEENSIDIKEFSNNYLKNLQDKK